MSACMAPPPAQSRKTLRPTKIPFSEVGYKLKLWPIYSTTRGRAPATLFCPDRRERQPVEGFAPALHRAAGAEPAARQARARSRQAPAEPLLARRGADRERARALPPRLLHAAPARPGAVHRAQGVGRGPGHGLARPRVDHAVRARPAAGALRARALSEHPAERGQIGRAHV